jgi:hypothetical protein
MSQRQSAICALCAAIALTIGCQKDPNERTSTPEGVSVEHDAKAEKIQHIERTVQAIMALHTIAKSRVAGKLDDDEVESKTDQVIAQIVDTESLQRFAVLANRIGYPGNADCSQYDNVFDYAFWEVVERIRKQGGVESAEALEEIGRLVCAQGGYAIRLNEAIESANKERR